MAIAARPKIQRIFQRRFGANLQDRPPAVTVCASRLFVGLKTAFTDDRPSQHQVVLAVPGFPLVTTASEGGGLLSGGTMPVDRRTKSDV